MALPAACPHERVPSRLAFDHSSLLGLGWSGKVRAAGSLGDGFGLRPGCEFQLCCFQVRDRTHVSWPPCPSVSPPVKRWPWQYPAQGVVVWEKGSDGWRGLCALPGRRTGAARPGGPGHWVYGLTVADDRGASFPRALRKLCCG